MANLIAKLDKEFSRYIRLRDAFPNGMFVCISCGRVLPVSEADCGHFVSRAHMATRYDEMNCNAECRHCNRFSATHLLGYREHLIQKYGEQKYEALVAEGRKIKKWSADELEAMIRYYKRQADGLSQIKGLKI